MAPVWPHVQTPLDTMIPRELQFSVEAGPRKIARWRVCGARRSQLNNSRLAHLLSSPDSRRNELRSLSFSHARPWFSHCIKRVDGGCYRSTEVSPTESIVSTYGVIVGTHRNHIVSTCYAVFVVPPLIDGIATKVNVTFFLISYWGKLLTLKWRQLTLRSRLKLPARLFIFNFELLPPFLFVFC